MVDPLAYKEQEKYPETLASFNLLGNTLECQSGELKLRLIAVTPAIIRIRYAIEGRFEDDFSYALDPKFNPEETTAHLADEAEFLVFSTALVDCKIKKSNLKISFWDKAGNLINKDEKGFHWEKNEKHGGHIIKMTKTTQAGEAFYGLGDKPTDLNLKGKRLKNWGTDTYGYHKGSDPLYKNIPFYYGLHAGIGYGIFFDNSFKSYFDFGEERKSANSFWTHGGEMNYYFIAGPALMDVCKRYTKMTGTPEMPPMWALGFQQCKWSYYPEAKVKEVARKMREHRIPCDAIYLDIDYMDGFRCFTWDKEKFPDPKRMVSELKADGFKTMVIIDPGIKKDSDYSIFKEGLEKDYFCKWPDGNYVEGKVWPGECYFPDFTKAEVREWWAGLFGELIEETGVAGVWNDMNEPALFEVESKTFSESVLHDYDGHPCSHRKAHNVYGMQMTRATADGVKRFSNGKRSLIITRSGYSGLQRFSSVWTGDNIATYEHLWLADVQAQRLAISGISFVGSDIGGFIGQPTGDLMVRWIQLGIFHPFCRVHSSGDHGEQEPWSFDNKTTELFKHFVELRYQLLPYLYTTFYQYHKEGIPFLRPIVFFDQQDSETIHRDHEFLCGDHILVCPVVKENVSSKKIYLPKGTWYNYWTNNRFQGSKENQVHAPIEKIPLFIKEGAIIPFYPVQQYVGELKMEELTLNAYHKVGSEISQLYEDAKDGYEYESGDFAFSTFKFVGSQNSVIIEQTKEGNYMTEFRYYKIMLIGMPFQVLRVTVDGEEIENFSNELKIPVEFQKIEIQG